MPRKRALDPIDIGDACDSDADHGLVDVTLDRFHWAEITFGGLPLPHLALLRADGNMNLKQNIREAEFAYNQTTKLLWMKFWTKRGRRSSFRSFERNGSNVVIRRAQRYPGDWSMKQDDVYRLPRTMTAKDLRDYVRTRR